MNTILTKFCGPTNTRGARVKAYSADNRPSTGRPDIAYVSWDYAVSGETNHENAARKLATKIGYESDKWHVGSAQHGYVFVRDYCSVVLP